MKNETIHFTEYTKGKSMAVCGKNGTGNYSVDPKSVTCAKCRRAAKLGLEPAAVEHRRQRMIEGKSV